MVGERAVVGENKKDKEWPVAPQVVHMGYLGRRRRHKSVGHSSSQSSD